MTCNEAPLERKGCRVLFKDGFCTGCHIFVKSAKSFCLMQSVKDEMHLQRASVHKRVAHCNKMNSIYKKQPLN